MSLDRCLIGRHLLIWFTFVLPTWGLNAQTTHPRFESIGLNEGLSQSSVFCIFQDRTGYMWFGTGDGLNRYDGYSIQVYRHEPFNPKSLPQGRVFHLFQRKDGSLWIVTQNGITRMDANSSTFTPIKSPIVFDQNFNRPNLSFMEDREGNLWLFGNFLTGALLKLEGDSFQYYPHEGRQAGMISDLIQDREGRLWLLTDTGVQRHEPSEGTFKLVAPLFLMEIHTMSKMVPDDFGTLWINGLGKLIRFDTHTNELKRYALTHKRLGIGSIAFDGSGKIWCTNDSGVDLFDPIEESFKTYNHEVDDPHSAPQSPTAIMISKAGIVWMTTGGQGLAWYDRSIDGFHYAQHDPTNPYSLGSNYLENIFEDRAGTIWVGGNDAGVFKYSPAKQKFRHYLHKHHQPKPISSPMVWSLLVDRDGYTWVGTDRDGLLRLDKNRTEILEKFESGKLVRGLFQDKHGYIWFSSGPGGRATNYHRLDPKTGEKRTYFRGSVISVHEVDSGFYMSCFNSGLQKYSYEDDRITRIAPEHIEDSEASIVLPDGRIVSGGNFGLVVYDPKSKQAKKYQYDPNDPTGISSDQVMDIHRDERGMLWLTFPGGGLNRLNLETDEVKHYNVADGLPNDFVYCILPDDQGFLWVSTNGGLSRFDPVKETFRNYDVHDGLQSLEFNMSAAHKAPDGELLFGGVSGFNAFYPNEVRINNSPPMLSVSAWQTPQQSLGKNLPFGSTISLEPGTPMIMFTYAGLDYVEPSKNTYAYMMDGFDGTWNMAGKHRRATYTNLPGGDYVFRLKAANSDGVWSDINTEINVRVAPHFYDTLFFRLAVTISLMTLLALLFVRQRRRLHKRQEEALMLRDHVRKSEELEYARQLQLAMIPKKDLRFGEVDVMGQMITASEVGGDYFDFFHLDEKRLCVAYGDATGHGVAAGLVVGMVKLAATVWAMNPKSIEQMMSELNQGLRKTLPLKTMGMGLGLAVLNLETYEVEMCSSGMPFPYHYQAATQRLKPLALKGPPLGYLKKINPATTAVQLNDGDRLIFLSDGFAERFNENNRLWGEKALVESLQKACSEAKKPSKIATMLIEACNAFAGARACDDDMTIVVLQRGSKSTAKAAAPASSLTQVEALN